MLFVLMAMTSLALADTIQVEDPEGDNFAPDHAAILDIKSASHDHSTDSVSGQGLLKHTITTYDAWDSSVLRDGTLLFIDFQVPGMNCGACLSLRITEDHGSLRAAMYRLFSTGKAPQFRGFAQAIKPDATTVTVEFSRSLLKPRHPAALKSYLWRAASFDHACQESQGDQTNFCSDRAPESFQRHRL
jgi:hypothetical protein